MKEIPDSRGSRVFWLGVALCTLYQSYRYPLQINSTGTSPSYSDTPLPLQLGKFILAAPLFAIATVQCFRKAASLRRWLIILAVLFLACYSLFKFFAEKDARFLDLSFWIVFSLALAMAADSVNVSSLDRYFRYLLLYALGSTAIMVFLYFAFGRLPALAFEGTYFIRFGSFWDDPNGFAAICYLLMGWAYWRFQGKVRFFVLLAIFASLLLTQSWTGLGFLVVMAFLGALFGVKKRPILALVVICISAWLIFFLVQHMPESVSEFIADMLAKKQESAEGHIVPWSQWSARWSGWVLLGDWTYNPYESWWMGALINFGIPWLGVCFALVAGLVFSTHRALSSAPREAKAVYSGLFLFGSYFAFGCLSLPYPMIFPINALFFLFSFLVAFGKIRLGDELPVVDAPMMGAGNEKDRGYVSPQAGSWNKA